MQAKLPIFAATSVPLLLALFLTLLARQPCDALRMINLDAPELALQGDTIKLSCFFSLRTKDINNNNNINHQPSSANHSRQTVSPASRQKSRLSGEATKFKYSSSARPSTEVVGDGGGGGGGSSVDKQHDAIEASGEFEVLYAIKWYKDEREFFRYLAHYNPKKQALPTDGVTVDVDKSDNHTVVLKSVSLKSSGSYKCEVSTDAPSFVTKSMERKMFVYALPNEGPSISQPTTTTTTTTRAALGWPSGPKMSASRYFTLGERVELVCSSRESKPAATLDWIINDSLNLSAFLTANSHTQHQLTTSPNESSTFSSLVAALFQVRSQRFVKLPALINLHSAGSRTLGQNGRPPINYELNNGTTSAAPQLPELSTTRLNFNVDANLLQLLVGKPDTEINSSTTKTKLIPTKKLRKKLKSGEGQNNELILIRIKCVARVLHLSMSDEVKLRLVNSTTWSKIDGDGQQSLSLQSNRGSNNRARSVTIIFMLIGLLVSFILTR